MGSPPGSVKLMGTAKSPCVGALTMNAPRPTAPGGPYSGVVDGHRPLVQVPDGRYCRMKSTSLYRFAELVTDTVPERDAKLCVPEIGKPYQAVGKPVAAVIVEPTIRIGLGQLQLGPAQPAGHT